MDGFAEGELVEVPAAVLEDAERAVALMGFLGHALRLVEVEGHGFFDHDVFVGGQGEHGVVEVHGGGGGDKDGIDLAVGQEVLNGGVDSEVSLAGEVGSGGGDVGDGYGVDVLGAREPGGVLRANSAEADDAYSDWVLGHVGNLKTKTPTSVIQH